MARVLSAEHHSKNLKEHREAFESRNGVLEPPIDPENEVSSVFATCLAKESVTTREIAQWAKSIRKLSERKIKHLGGITLLYRALGYKDQQEALTNLDATGKIPNRNYGCKDVAGLCEEITEERRSARRALVKLLGPLFSRIARVGVDWLESDPLIDTLAGWRERIRPELLPRYGIDEEVDEGWCAYFIIAALHPQQPSSNVLRRSTYLKGHRASDVRYATDYLARQQRKKQCINT